MNARLLCLLAALCWLMTPGWSEPERPVLGREFDGPVKAVVDVSSGAEIGGTNEGLEYLRRVRQAYLKSDLPVEDLDLRGVFHGEAATSLLTDAAWQRVTGKTGPNPNTTAIEELVAHGVAIELCDARRRRQGWAMEDIHPRVTLVGNAYLRLIDLQMQGFVYLFL